MDLREEQRDVMKGREIRLATGASLPHKICTRGWRGRASLRLQAGGRVDVRDLLAAD